MQNNDKLLISKILDKIRFSKNRIINSEFLIKTSRKIAQEFLEDEKVSINYTVETKATKGIKEKDILIIRGKGKFIVDEFLGKNKKGKEIIRIKKYM